MKLLLGLLFILSGSVGFSQTVVDLDSFKYIKPKFDVETDIKHAGHFIANKINFKNEHFYINVKNKEKYKADIYLNPRLLEFISKDASDYGFSTQHLGFFMELGYLNADNFKLNIDEEVFAAEAKILETNLENHHIKLENFDITCTFKEIPFPFNCLNESSLKPKEINSEKKYVLLTYKDPKEKVNIKTEIISTKLTEDKINFHINKLSSNDEKTFVTINDTKVDCAKKEQQDDVFKTLDVILECANFGKFNILRFHINQDEKNTQGFKFNVKSTEDTIKVEGKLLTLRNEFLEILIKDLSAECRKRIIKSESKLNDILLDCYEWSNLKAKKSIYKDKDKNVGDFVFEGIDLRDNDMKIIASEIDFTHKKFELSVSLKKLIGSCPKNEKMKEFSFNKIINHCLTNASLNLESLAITGKGYNIDIETDKIGLHKDTFFIVGKKLVFTAPKKRFTANGFNITCLREIDETNALNFSNVPQKCFESSSIKIDQIIYENILFKMNIDFEGIEFSQDKISLKIPKATYTLNDEDIEFTDLDFTCFLDKKIKKIENLNMDNLLEVCLSNSTVELKKLKNSGSSGIKVASLARMDSIKFDSRGKEGGNFTLGLYPIIKYLGFIKPKMLKGTLKGNLSYNKNQKKVIIRMDSFRIWKTIPAKKVLKHVINSFIDHKKVTLDGDTISIQMGE